MFLVGSIKVLSDLELGNVDGFVVEFRHAVPVNLVVNKVLVGLGNVGGVNQEGAQVDILQIVYLMGLGLQLIADGKGFIALAVLLWIY